MARPRTKEPILTSEAQAQLAECYVAGDITIAQIARATGASVADVHNAIVNGTKPRGSIVQGLTKKPYEIPAWMWGVPPGTTELPTDDIPELPEPDDEAKVDAVDLSSPDAALGLVEQQIRRLSKDLTKARKGTFGIEPNQILRLEQAYTAASLNFARLKHELGPADENRLARSVTYQRLVQRVVKALEPYPEAQAAVLEEFGRVK